MPKISELKDSKFLTKDDCDPPIRVTCSHVTQENLALESQPPELKWCLHFHEAVKPMVINLVNGQTIAKIAGTDEMDDWNGTEIVLWNDPSVSYGGKLVGGVRVQMPQAQPAAPVSPPPAPSAPSAPSALQQGGNPDLDSQLEDIPF